MSTMRPSRAEKIGREVTRMYAGLGFLSGLYTFVRLRLAPIVRVEEYVPSRAAVLDLGCGNGIFANILVLGSGDRKVKGVDLSEGRIQIAQRIASRNPKLEFVQADVGSYPVGKCDVVTIVDLLHHMDFSSQKLLLQRVFECLDRGAAVLIKDLERSPLWKYVFHYVQDTVSYRSRLYFRSAGDMEAELRKIGFEVRTVSLAAGYMHPHVLYCCRKP